jgi:hypothetical protein
MIIGFITIVCGDYVYCKDYRLYVVITFND